MEPACARASQASTSACALRWASAIAPHCTSRGKLRPPAYWLRACKKGGYAAHLYGLTFGRSTHHLGQDALTLLPPVSHASPGAWLADGVATKTSGTCGRQPIGSSRQFALAFFFSKTCQVSSQAEALSLSGETYARWTTAWKQGSLARLKSARRTSASGSLCLPTPLANQTDGQSRPGEKACGQRRYTLVGMARLGIWPTPRLTDSAHATATPWEMARPANKDLLHARVARREMEQAQKTATPGRRGLLNAEWVTLLMGFPRGWTRIPGETDGKMTRRA